MSTMGPNDRTTGSVGVDRDTRDDEATRRRGADVVGVDNEAETNRRDRIRWGPVWAGIVVAVGTYLLLQLALVATGLVDIGGTGTGDALASAAAALIAFLLGGITAGASAMWRGADDGVLHGIVLWAVGLVSLLLISALGSGLALGAIDASEAFTNIGDVEAAEANETAQDAAARALLGLTAALVASAVGGSIGAKMWPNEDELIDLETGRTSTGARTTARR